MLIKKSFGILFVKKQDNFKLLKIMKKLIFLFVVFISTTSSAQNTIEENIPAFNEIKVFDLIEVEMIKAETNKVIVSGANIEDVKIMTDDEGVLKIRMELDTRFNGNDTKVKVFYTNLEVVDANEGSVIRIKDRVDQETLEARCQEGGFIYAELNVNSGYFKSVSGGSINLTGTIRSQNITVNTGGGFRGEELQSLNTTITVTAGGEAEVFASERIEAKVTAGGSIYVYGNPKDITKKKRLGGKIIIKE